MRTFDRRMSSSTRPLSRSPQGQTPTTFLFLHIQLSMSVNQPKARSKSPRYPSLGKISPHPGSHQEGPFRTSRKATRHSQASSPPPDPPQSLKANPKSRGNKAAAQWRQRRRPWPSYRTHKPNMSTPTVRKSSYMPKKPAGMRKKSAETLKNPASKNLAAWDVQEAEIDAGNPTEAPRTDFEAPAPLHGAPGR